ncbi:MAG: fibronectin type III domain-containing protein [Thermoplasmatota archaeon]
MRPLSKGTAVAFVCTLLLLAGPFLVIDTEGDRTRAPPSGPTNFQVESQDRKVKLTWEDPEDDGGSDRIGYNIYKGRSIGEMTQLSNLGPYVYMYVDTNVVNGVIYYYSVRAINENDGEGADSDILSVKPVGPSYPPKNVTSSYSSGEVTFTWKAPEVDGGNPIQGYALLRGRSASSFNTRINLTVVYTYTDITVTNGVPYYYRLLAYNGYVDGTPTEIIQVTPRGKPGIVHNLTITPGDRQVNLTWGYPLDDGGGSITGYKIYRGLSSGSLEVAGEVSFTKMGYLDLEVTNGVTYYYSVSALNMEGEGTLTDPVPVTPLGVPANPRNLTVRPGDTKAYLSWKEPLDDGGSDLEGYTIYRTTVGATMRKIDTIGLELEFVDGNLTNGETYYYLVRALNEYGESLPSESIAVKPDASPAPPPNFRVREFKGYIQLVWSLPSFQGDYPVKEFKLYKGETEEDLELLATLSRNDSMYLDEEVEVGVTYYYSIRSYSIIGDGDFSDVLSGIPYSEPGLVENVILDVGSGYVTLAWDPPPYTGGRDIVNYKVYRGDNPDKLVVIETLSGDSDSFTDTTVKNGKVYYYSIQAINSQLDGNLTSPVEAKPTGPASSPRNLVASTVDGAIFLQWEEPVDNGGQEITSYILLRGNHQNNVSFHKDVGLVLNYTDEDAEPGVGYFYAVVATNLEGESPASSAAFVEITRTEGEEEEESNSMVMIIVITVVVVLLIALIIGGIILSRKKGEDEDRDEEPQFQESEREKEHRLMMERRKKMSEFTDVALTTEEAHAIDHEEHHLSYEDLYGNVSGGEEKTQSSTDVQSGPVDAQTPVEGSAPPEQPSVQPQPAPVEYQKPPAEIEEEQPAPEGSEYIPPS